MCIYSSWPLCWNPGLFLVQPGRHPLFIDCKKRWRLFTVNDVRWDHEIVGEWIRYEPHIWLRPSFGGEVNKDVTPVIRIMLLPWGPVHMDALHSEACLSINNYYFKWANVPLWHVRWISCKQHGLSILLSYSPLSLTIIEYIYLENNHAT